MSVRVSVDLMSTQRPGPGYSKLTASFVSVLLKFQTLMSEICQYFSLKNCEKLLPKASLVFSTKNITKSGYKIVKHFTS